MNRSVPRRLAALLGLLCGLGVALLVLAGPAAAHATLVTGEPADGARLAAAPASVSVTFDEPVGLGSLGYLHVTDQAGRRVERGAAFHPNGDGSTVAVNLVSGLGDGTYTESFRVVSADSHPVAGVVRFVVGNGVLAAASGPDATVDHVTSAVFEAVRWVSFVGFALLGGVWLLLTVWPSGRDDRRARQIVWTGWAAATGGAVIELLLQGPYVAGEGLSAIGTGSLLDATLHTSYGQYHCARLLLLGLLGLLLGRALQGEQRRSFRFEDAAWPIALGVALTFSAAGHADTTSPAWLSVALDAAHITAMAAWLGGLVLLVGAVLPRRDPDEQRAVLPTVSRVALVAVATLAVSGGYAAWRGVGSVDAVLTTTYGRLVLTKLVLLAGLLLLGNFARRAVQRHFGERLRRAVLVEIALAGAVLVATSVLVSQPRGQEALAVSRQKPVTAAAALGGGRTATVTVDPGRHGVVTVALALSAGPQPQDVTATAALPSAQLGPIPVPLSANGTGLYGASGVDLPVAGRWVITLVVTTSEFSATTAQVTVRLY